MGLMQKVKKMFNRNPSVVRYEILSDYGAGYSGWAGDLYNCELVRSCIRPYATAIGKLSAKHLRESDNAELKVFPEAYMRMLLQDPNPLMTMQSLQEKLAINLALNNNAFAYINRDNNGYPIEIYPVDAMFCEAVYDNQRNLYLKFSMKNGRIYTYPYWDIIHLRKDFKEDIFGSSNVELLKALLDVVAAGDQSVINAIKNSGVIKWLLKFNTTLHEEELVKQTRSFAKAFLAADAVNGNVGVAATDAKAEAKQIEPKDYVPNAAIMDRATSKFYRFFGTNEKIVTSSFNEDEWNAYFESMIEPVSKQMSLEFTRKLFTRRECSLGNRIVFDAASLTYASMSTKLNLEKMLDRGAMTANEWRKILNLAAIEGGNTPIRRLDTAPVSDNEGNANENDKN